MASTTARSTQAWQNLRAHILATHPPICSWCKRPINLELSGMHKWGPTVDHGLALQDGGQLLDPEHCTPMHRTCNITKENLTRKTRTTQHTTNTSRDW